MPADAVGLDAGLTGEQLEDPRHVAGIEAAADGFDADGQPKEVFLVAGKAGSMLNALLADAAVAVSVSLQHGVLAGSLAKSIGRVPAAAGAGLDRPPIAELPASPLGSALDLLARLEAGARPAAK